MISSAKEAYDIVSKVMEHCRECGHVDIIRQLEDALYRGSTGREVLGAVRNVFLNEAPRLKRIVGAANVEALVWYVHRAFGT